MKRQLLSLTALLGLWGALALGGGGTASAADAQWTETGSAQVDSLGSSQGPASRAKVFRAHADRGMDIGAMVEETW